MDIESWCQKVLDLLDLSFAELFGIYWNISLDFALWMDIFYLFQCCSQHFIYIFQPREEISGISAICGFYGIFQIFSDDLPKPPSQANSETKKVHPVNSSTHAKLEQQV